ncbi:MAG: CDP-archaeol synthase [Clostridia bacterium]|nr:CDP-archaeol synthase [Clostridia bacterium]
MKTRIISSIVATAILLPFLFYSHTYAFACLMAFGACLGVYEMLKCLGEKNLFILIPSCLIGAAMPILAKWYPDEATFFNFAHKVFVVYVFYLAVIAVFSKGKKDVSAMALVYVTVCFIVNGFSSITILRDYQYGEYIYLLVFLCPWMTDIFAYFTGYFFGKHKLIPEVSPKKTIEGAIGGVVFCTLSLVLYGFLVSCFADGIKANYLAFVLVGVVLSVVSQCGDLIFSLIKRKFGIKDYGNIMPGHGGILDRCDSVIAAAPFVLWMFDLSKIFRLFYEVV